MFIIANKNVLYNGANYTDSKVDDHGGWLQAHIAPDIVVSWAEWNEEKITLSGVHSLDQGEAIFVDKKNKVWPESTVVKYYKGAGYYITGYDSTTMANWDVKGNTVAQLRGDCAGFVDKMARSWRALTLEVNWPRNETPFAKWLTKHIPSQYSGSTFDAHNDWFQVKIPDSQLTVSWGTVPHTQLKFREVEALYEDKPLFVAKASEEGWDKLPNVEYYPGVGYYIPKYDSATMGGFGVSEVAVIHFNGASATFVDQMVKAYKKNPAKSELEFTYWLKDYVNEIYPSLKVDYNGAWYQSNIPQLDLSVAWGTMAGVQMDLKALHGLRKDKSIFIGNQAKEDWDAIPSISFNPEAGYYVDKYDEATMGDFQVGRQTVLQYNGEGFKKFTDSMVEAWKAAPKAQEKYRVINDIRFSSNRCGERWG